jgi:hypothetical protein
LPALQRLLGHNRLTITRIYLNLSPEEVVRKFREKWEILWPVSMDFVDR